MYYPDQAIRLIVFFFLPGEQMEFDYDLPIQRPRFLGNFAIFFFTTLQKTDRMTNVIMFKIYL